jgi:hypothetical protein
MASEKPRASERRLKFSSVRRLKSQNVSQQTPGPVVRVEPVKHDSALAAIGGLFTAAYVSVARQVLVGFEAVQDRRAERRATALRRSVRADAASSVRNEASSPTASTNSRGDDLL